MSNQDYNSPTGSQKTRFPLRNEQSADAVTTEKDMTNSINGAEFPPMLGQNNQTDENAASIGKRQQLQILKMLVVKPETGGATESTNNLNAIDEVQQPLTAARDMLESQDPVGVLESRATGTVTPSIVSVGNDYLRKKLDEETNGGTDVGVQSNNHEVLAPRPLPPRAEVEVTTFQTNVEGENGSKKQKNQLKKEKREGKTIPAVDFMDLNKTVINFNATTRQDNALSPKFDSSVADGETKDVSNGGTMSGISQPKLKQMGAFRHTEYAKGFYKVGGTVYDGAAISHGSSVGDANTAMYSEAERTNVLENQSRQPLTKKIFGRAGGRGGKSIPSGAQRHTIMPALTVETNTSRFNSTTDSFYPRKATQKPGVKSPPPAFMNSTRARSKQPTATDPTTPSAIINHQSGVTGGDPLISFGRAIGPGSSLQPASVVEQRILDISKSQQPPSQLEPLPESKQSSRKGGGVPRQRLHQTIDQMLLASNDGSIDIKLSSARRLSDIGSSLHDKTASRNVHSRRNNSVVVTQVGQMLDQLPGNFGHPVHKACPKDFSLTPLNKLKPMEFDLTLIPREMKVTSDPDQNDLNLVRQKLRRQRFDHMNYDPFVDTEQGQALYTGVLKEDQDGDACVENDATEAKNLYAYLIQNGLLNQSKKQRGGISNLIVTRENFAQKVKHPETERHARKSQPLSKFKELRSIYKRNDVPIIPLKKIQKRIAEHYERQNTKEYMNSWLYERREIEKKLDEGFHVHVDKDLLKRRNYAGSTYQSDARLGGGPDSADGDGAPQSLDILTRIPSQKLSILIQRKNTIQKKERKRQEKMERMRSEMEAEELEELEAQRAYKESFGAGSQHENGAGHLSDRTIQAMKTTSQMILSPKNSQLQGGTGNVPAWMVTSQIVASDQTAPVVSGTTRVVTRKLNQIVKNPPSMSSSCVKQTLLAKPSKATKNSKQAHSSFMQMQSQMQGTTVFSSKLHNIKTFNNTSAFNNNVTSKVTETQNISPVQYNQQFSQTQGPLLSDYEGTTTNEGLISFAQQEDAQKGRNNSAEIAQQDDAQIGRHNSAENQDGGRFRATQALATSSTAGMNQDLPGTTIRVQEFDVQMQQPFQLDEPSQFEAIQNQAPSMNNLARAATTVEPRFDSPMTKKALRKALQAEEFMSKAQPGSRAAQILQRHLMRTNSGKEDGTESLFSADLLQTNLPLSKEKVMAFIGSDQTITVRDHEVMDQLSNISISQMDIPKTVANIFDSKKYDCIQQICNFREKVPSEIGKAKMITKDEHQTGHHSHRHGEKHSSTKMGPAAGSSLLKDGSSRRSNHFVMQDSHSSMGDKTSLTGDETNLGYQLGVVIERCDGDSTNEHSAPNSDKNMALAALGREKFENNLLRSELGSDRGGDDQRSIAFDGLSSMRNTNLGGGIAGDSISKHSRIKRKLLNQARLLMDKIKEFQEAQGAVSQRGGGGPAATISGTTAYAGPQTAPSSSYYAPNPSHEIFLIEKLAQVLDLREETLSVEEYIGDFLHFKEFNDNENIIEKVESQKRQKAANRGLFETQEEIAKFNDEKQRQMLKQKQQRATLNLWSFDPNKSRTRGFQLQTKMTRKEPLDMGVNTKKKDLPPKVVEDKRKAPYDAGCHFDEIAKLCHNMLSDLKTIPKLTIRPKKTSNNVKLDDDGEGKRKQSRL